DAARRRKLREDVTEQTGLLGGSRGDDRYEARWRATTEHQQAERKTKVQETVRHQFVLWNKVKAAWVMARRLQECCTISQIFRGVDRCRRSAAVAAPHKFRVSKSGGFTPSYRSDRVARGRDL